MSLAYSNIVSSANSTIMLAVAVAVFIVFLLTVTIVINSFNER